MLLLGGTLCELSGTYGQHSWPAKERWTTGQTGYVCKTIIPSVDELMERAERMDRKDDYLKKETWLEPRRWFVFAVSAQGVGALGRLWVQDVEQATWNVWTVQVWTYTVPSSWYIKYDNGDCKRVFITHHRFDQPGGLAKKNGRNWYRWRRLLFVIALPMLQQLKRMEEARNWRCTFIEVIRCMSWTANSLIIAWEVYWRRRTIAC